MKRIAKKTAKAYVAAYQGLPRSIWFLGIVTFVNHMGTMAYPFLSLYITQQLGGSIGFAGMVLGLYGVGAMLGSFLGGYLSDRLNPITAMLIGFIGAGVTLLSFEFMHDLYVFAAITVVYGLFGQIGRPASGVAFAACCPSEMRSRAFAFHRLAINLGTSFGPAVGGLLVTINYAWLFRVDGLTYLLAALLLFVLPIGLDTVKPTERKKVSSLAPLKNLHFLGLLLISVVMGAVFFQVFATLPLYLKDDYHLPESSYGLLISFNGVLIIIFEMVVTHKLENHRPLLVLALGNIFVAIGLGILPFGMGILFAAFSTLFWTFGEIVASPCLQAYVANIAEDHERGTYLGYLSLTFSIALIIGPLLGSQVYYRFGGNVLWFGCGLSSFITAAVVYYQSLKTKES